MRILFISHQLSLTGAPMVLLDVIRFCLKEGYSVDVRYFTDGDLRPAFEELGIRLIHQKGFDGEKAEEFVFAAREYDLIWANTIVCNQAIHLLNLIDKPVIWWLHEGPAYFDLFASSLPDFAKLRPGIHILAVSPRVRKLGMFATMKTGTFSRSWWRILSAAQAVVTASASIRCSQSQEGCESCSAEPLE